jgi:hypothetical protein
MCIRGRHEVDRVEGDVSRVAGLSRLLPGRKAKGGGSLTADEALDRLPPNLRELLARLAGQTLCDLQVTLQLLPLGSRLALDTVGAARLDDDPVDGRYRLKVLPFCVDLVKAAALRAERASEQGLGDSRTDQELANALEGQPPKAEAQIWPVSDDPSEALESLQGWLEDEPTLVGHIRTVTTPGESRDGPEQKILVAINSTWAVPVLARCLTSWVQARDIRVKVAGQGDAVLEIKADSKAEQQIEAQMLQTLNIGIG